MFEEEEEEENDNGGGYEGAAMSLYTENFRRSENLFCGFKSNDRGRFLKITEDVEEEEIPSWFLRKPYRNLLMP